MFPALRAQGTQQWTTQRFEDFERGTATGVAIRNDGRLEPAPHLETIASTKATYLWSLLPQRDGSTLVGTGVASGGSQLLRIDPKGATTTVADFKELTVTAIAQAPDGSTLVATAPDGKVYRIGPGGKPEVIFDPTLTAEKPKYLWSLAVTPSGDILVAAGAPAAIYRIAHGAALGTKPELLFQSGDQHIRTLLLSADGNTLFAGSDGSGIVYRIPLNTPGHKAFALYTAPKHEITSLALDPAGNLYLAAIGDRRPPALPPLPAAGEPRISITFTQPGSSVAAPTNALVPDGSEIDRIAPDDTPTRLLNLREEITYALAWRGNALLAATGNRGHIYRIDPSRPGSYTDVAHTEANQAVAMAATANGVRIVTANSGRLLELQDTPAADSTYTSDVFDGTFATQWGRAELTGTRDRIDLFARSGNVENNRSGLGDLWSDWQPVRPDQTPLPVPVARYLQWKAVLHPGAVLNAVAVNYLQRNVPPTVEDVVVQPGARVPSSSPATPPTTVPVTFRANGTSAPTPPAEITPGPLLAQRDPKAVTVRWIARDPNGDDLMFAVYARGIGEQTWRLLKDHISERVYSFDSSLLPDGQYEIRIVASDAPVHSDADALTAERISEPFIIDTTPPTISPLTAALRDGRLTAAFEAHDATSPISHAEFSIDAGPWQYLEPIGRLSDSLAEHYLLDVPMASTTPSAGEHTVAVRVFDRNENTTSAKALVR
ncbi:WD40 repeat domain-containing protein [Terriglobus aquaticus]|uniref:WD40 repeat domain-containing protein n=1 Tax=Terriglobus aquaticus TaxID=940139 RepID=A0ABW9KIV5_9BACT|nr:hypothetical protein [Terriglobus aquaticus]